MSLIYGSGLLFAALMLLCVGRAVFARLDSDAAEPGFGPTEALGLAVTALLVVGIAFLLRHVAADPGVVSAAMAAGALVAVVLAATLALRVAARLGQRGRAPADTGLPDGRPAGRGSGGSGRPASAPRRKRAA